MLFISYSSSDKDLAADLQRRLQGRGFTCDQEFLDGDQRSGMSLGGNWEAAIYDNLRRCQAVLVLCTPNWLQSRWCFAELALAKVSGKQIIPILMENCDLTSLSEYQPVVIPQTSSSEREQAFDRLFADLEARGLGANDIFPWPNPELKDASGQIDPCPFPGLSAFDERYAAVYFGRERETATILEKLRQVRSRGEPRVLMIVGCSGSGKSSLLKAGVLPRLKLAAARRDWLVLPILRFRVQESNHAPFESLADGIVSLYPPRCDCPGGFVPDRKTLIAQLVATTASGLPETFWMPSAN